MDRTFLQDFAAGGEIRMDPLLFSGDLLCVVLLSWILGKFYVRYSRVFSNRENFSRNFVPVGVATFFLISIIKSSLALSLGLVGALSIVRFRAAIKEPEELSYLFLSIAVGVGFGAGQRPLTSLMFVVVLAVLYALQRWDQPTRREGLFLTVSGLNQMNAEELTNVLAKNCKRVKLRQWQEGNGKYEASFIADFTDFQSFVKVKEALKGLDSGVRIGLVDTEGLA